MRLDRTNILTASKIAFRCRDVTVASEATVCHRDVIQSANAAVALQQLGQLSRLGFIQLRLRLEVGYQLDQRVDFTLK